MQGHSFHVTFSPLCICCCSPLSTTSQNKDDIKKKKWTHIHIFAYILSNSLREHLEQIPGPTCGSVRPSEELITTQLTYDRGRWDTACTWIQGRHPKREAALGLLITIAGGVFFFFYNMVRVLCRRHLAHGRGAFPPPLLLQQLDAVVNVKLDRPPVPLVAHQQGAEFEAALAVGLRRHSQLHEVPLQVGLHGYALVLWPGALKYATLPCGREEKAQDQIYRGRGRRFGRSSAESGRWSPDLGGMHRLLWTLAIDGQTEEGTVALFFRGGRPGPFFFTVTSAFSLTSSFSSSASDSSEKDSAELPDITVGRQWNGGVVNSTFLYLLTQQNLHFPPHF